MKSKVKSRMKFSFGLGKQKVQKFEGLKVTAGRICEGRIGRVLGVYLFPALVSSYTPAPPEAFPRFVVGF